MKHPPRGLDDLLEIIEIYFVLDPTLINKPVADCKNLMTWTEIKMADSNCKSRMTALLKKYGADREESLKSPSIKQPASSKDQIKFGQLLVQENIEEMKSLCSQVSFDSDFLSAAARLVSEYSPKEAQAIIDLLFEHGANIWTITNFRSLKNDLDEFRCCLSVSAPLFAIRKAIRDLKLQFYVDPKAIDELIDGKTPHEWVMQYVPESPYKRKMVAFLTEIKKFRDLHEPSDSLQQT